MIHNGTLSELHHDIPCSKVEEESLGKRSKEKHNFQQSAHFLRWSGGDLPWVWPPPRMPVANMGLKGFPTRNVTILVVTVTVRRPYPRSTYLSAIYPPLGKFFRQRKGLLEPVLHPETFWILSHTKDSTPFFFLFEWTGSPLDETIPFTKKCCCGKNLLGGNDTSYKKAI